MRIGINALYILHSKSGGAYIYLHNLLLELARLDKENEYYIFVSSSNRELFYVQQSNFQYILVRGPVPFQPYRILAENTVVPFLIKKHSLDVFYSPADVLPFWVPCRSIMMVQNLLHLHQKLSPIEGTIWRRLFLLSRSWYYLFATRASAKRADRVVAVSGNTKKELCRFARIDENKVVVVYHGVSDIFRRNTKRSGLTANSPSPLGYIKYILYVSAISPYKNFDKAIRALKLLKVRYSVSHKFLAIGRVRSVSYANYLEGVIQDLNLESDVLFLDYLPHEELASLYQNAALFVFPSCCESFGLPLLEAMASGIPVIASNRSSIPEIVGDAGVIIDTDDIGKFADEMAKILSDSELRNDLINKGYARSKQFSWERTAENMLAIYEKIYQGDNR